MTTANIDDELRVRLRQQELLAELGACALRGGGLSDLLQEATRLVALGLETKFAKALQYLRDEKEFLVCAGVGWRPMALSAMPVSALTFCPRGIRPAYQ